MKTACVKSGLIIAGVVAVLSGGARADVNDWLFAMPITFEGYAGSGPLTNFPALVVFSNNVAGSGFDYATLATDSGADLWFADETGNELLYHEIQSWDTNGVSYVWVQVPELTSNTVIKARWGDPEMTVAPAYTTNGLAWPAEYRGVWHLAEASGTRHDSTTNNFHGTVNGALTATNGVIGTGLAFDGANGTWLNLGQLGQEEPATVEMWFKQNSDAYPEEITSRFIWVQSGHIGGYQGGDIYFNRDNGLGVTDTNTQGKWLIPRSELDLVDNWFHMAMVYHGTTASVYINGEHKATSSATVRFRFGSTISAALGRRLWNAHHFSFKGLMDEVRLSSVERSADWIQASYTSQAAPLDFATYGPALEKPPAGTVIMIQ